MPLSVYVLLYFNNQNFIATYNSCLHPGDLLIWFGSACGVLNISLQSICQEIHYILHWSWHKTKTATYVTGSVLRTELVVLMKWRGEDWRFNHCLPAEGWMRSVDSQAFGVLPGSQLKSDETCIRRDVGENWEMGWCRKAKSMAGGRCCQNI